MIPQAPQITPIGQSAVYGTRPGLPTPSPVQLGNPEGPVGITPIGLGQPPAISDDFRGSPLPSSFGAGSLGQAQQPALPLPPPAGVNPPIGAGAGGAAPQLPTPQPPEQQPPTGGKGAPTPPIPLPKPGPTSASQLANKTLGGIQSNNAPNLPDFNSEELQPFKPTNRGGLGFGFGGFGGGYFGGFGDGDFGSSFTPPQTPPQTGEPGSPYYGPPTPPGFGTSPPPPAIDPSVWAGYSAPPQGAPQLPPPINSDAGFVGPAAPPVGQGYNVPGLLNQNDLLAPYPGLGFGGLGGNYGG